MKRVILLCIISIFLFLPVKTMADVQVTLAWDANSDPDLAGYRIYTSTTSGGDYSLNTDVSLGELSNPNNPQVTITVSQRKLYYVATAYDNKNYWCVGSEDPLDCCTGEGTGTCESLESGYSNEVYDWISCTVRHGVISGGTTR